MEHSLGRGGHVGAGTGMAPIPEEICEFIGADSHGIRNTTAVGATGTCATGGGGDLTKIGTAIPRVCDPVGCAAKPLVGQELPPEPGAITETKEGKAISVLHAT